MVQLVDHPFDGGNITVLRSRVQFSFLPLFCICHISHGHVIYNLIWSRIGSTWNLVGICLEFGRNDSESRSNLGGFSLTFHSYQIPTIPTIPPGFLPFQSDSTWNLLGSTWIPSTPPGSRWNVRGRVKYCHHKLSLRPVMAHGSGQRLSVTMGIYIFTN